MYYFVDVRGNKRLRFAGSFMELAGLEPATSWVRFKSTATANPHHKRLSGRSVGEKPLGYPALTQGFWGWNTLHPQYGRAR
jgi:hypothetical protein